MTSQLSLPVRRAVPCIPWPWGPIDTSLAPTILGNPFLGAVTVLARRPEGHATSALCEPCWHESDGPRIELLRGRWTWVVP
jgi:hypothetical protein